uniref:Zinc-ribbon domain-containing protein n=1 Tax=Solibacter usitatus (strain Ellin6076) TaxID=234267 RepID=Q01ST3_SOLUE
MPFCASCGSQVDGSFCAKCGARAGTAVPASGPAVQAAPLADNVASALCYVLGLITGIIFLVLAPYNKNPKVRFHAFQSIFLHAGCIALAIGLNIVVSILHLWSFLFLGSIVWLGFFILWIYLIIQAYQGNTIELPVIGPIARQQAGV